MPGVAQIKAPIFEPEKTKAPLVKEATEADDFKHGNRLVITKKDDTQIVGTLVRVDRKGKRFFLRTEPGEPPVAVQNDEVKKAEKIMVRGAAGGSAAEQSDNRPEIHRMVIFQGTDIRVHYFATTLSPVERTNLAQIEAAENELARLQDLASLNAQYVRDERALQTRRRHAQEAYFQAQEALYSLAVNPWFLYLPYTVGYWACSGSYFPLGSYYGIPPISPPEMANEGVLKAALATTLVRSASPEVLAKARENLALAQRNAVYEDGRIVAVLYSPREREHVAPAP